MCSSLFSINPWLMILNGFWTSLSQILILNLGVLALLKSGSTYWIKRGVMGILLGTYTKKEKDHLLAPQAVSYNTTIIEDLHFFQLKNFKLDFK